MDAASGPGPGGPAAPDRPGGPPRGRVIVVGSINLDLVLRLPRLPRPGETVTGGTLARHHGGKGANQAVAAARAGATVHLIGAVGEDDGQASIDAIAAEGIDVSAVARLRGAHTGHAVVIVDGSGENQIAVAPGANATVDPRHVRQQLAGLLLGRRDVIVLSFELGDEPLLAAAAGARRAGATLLVNPAPPRRCDPRLLSGAIITPNRHELGALSTGRTDSGAGEVLRARQAAAPPATALPATAPPVDEVEADGVDGVAVDVAAAASTLARSTGGPVVATLGRYGALVADDAGVEHFPGHQVLARDTTGAGDTLTGVLAAGLAAGCGRRTAVRRAVAAAALSVTRPGAREGMPSAAQIDALLGGR